MLWSWGRDRCSKEPQGLWWSRRWWLGQGLWLHSQTWSEEFLWSCAATLANKGASQVQLSHLWLASEPSAASSSTVVFWRCAGSEGVRMAFATDPSVLSILASGDLGGHLELQPLCPGDAWWACLWKKSSWPERADGPMPLQQEPVPSGRWALHQV